MRKRATKKSYHQSVIANAAKPSVNRLQRDHFALPDDVNIYASRLIIICLIGLLAFQSCREKPVDEKQLARDKITMRTLGLAYLEENKLEEAEAEFLKLTDLAPDEALGFANLGLVYLRMDDYPRALKHLDKAIEIDAKDANIRLIRAKAFELNDDTERAVKELETTLNFAPDDPKVLYQLAELYAKGPDENSKSKRIEYLTLVAGTSPQNIVPRLQLIEVQLQTGDLDLALKSLEEIGQQFPSFTPEAADFYEKTVDELHNGRVKEALTSLLIFHNFLKLTTPYQAGIKELKGPGGALIGFPVISFSESTTSFVQEGESLIDAMKFTDVTPTAGLDFGADFAPENAHLSVGDLDGDGDQDIYFASNANSGYKRYLLFNELGMFKASENTGGIDHEGKEVFSAFADYDNDGHLDILILKENGLELYRNESEGTFGRVTDDAFPGVSETQGRTSLYLDIDHEGDLDLVVGGVAGKLLRNDGDGAFSDQTDQVGFVPNNTGVADLALGDFDDDGDVDFIVVHENGQNVLYSNLRQGRFEDATSKSGLQPMSSSGAVTVGDYNNDGYLDLFLTALDGSGYRLYRNKSDGTYEEDKASSGVFEVLKSLKGYDATFFDFDNDGHLDILVIGAPVEAGGKGAYLFHNDGWGNFEDESRLLPPEFGGGTRVQPADYNEDGDLDLYLVDLEGKLRLLRNDGGNGNHHLKMKLVGLRTGSGKNNHFGIGAKVEVRAGDLYQMMVVTSPNVHFGMGNRTKADVVRIMWTNGVPQNMFFPDSDRNLIEEQELKGSCPFLYTWNGKEYVFVKDMMWRSALGMPLGIMGGKQAYAFADASEEYLKIPGELLQPRNGEYIIQMTEELWETIYADEIKLIAVDHHADAEIYVDEKFAAPPYPELKVFKVKEHRQPVSAVDEKGNDLSALIREKDNRYISNFRRMKFQGITEMKDLILDLGNVEDTENLHLFLNGWIFPTDASINVAISQSNQINIKHPSLEVINEKGAWQEVIPGIGFPSGKNKTVIVDLSDKFLTKERKVRIRTNMEIYWDFIFFARDEDMEIEMTAMAPVSADYHYRGFSAKSRKGGRYGPHWFDYHDVTTGQKWRDLTGMYTRYGDVTELLQEADDRYIIANAGDETTISFDAERLPKLRQGWKRDFLIYSVGWVKDGDLNTALGQTVEPLPFHGMSKYPYGDDEHYPTDKAHTDYRKRYNTRKVGTKDYQEFVRKGAP
ncbi:MAG: FG-GAP-like repeat-containing protein [Cytophagales bacterium]|nr:FG-GAP-like repeat-containing protein [Cytophagales bacterium]